MKNTLLENAPSDKKKRPIRCSHCSTTLVVRNGTYPRNDPQNDTEIRVQRYLCKSPECTWYSFSVLPAPLLPVIRHAYEKLFSCYAMIQKGINQAAVARKLSLGRGVVKRLKPLCRKFITWLDQERKVTDWGLDPLLFWPDFTRDFSQSFFPERWIKSPSTQHEH